MEKSNSFLPICGHWNYFSSEFALGREGDPGHNHLFIGIDSTTHQLHSYLNVPATIENTFIIIFLSSFFPSPYQPPHQTRMAT